MGRAYEVRKAAMAKTHAMKAKLYSRFGKEIYQVAKTGGPDPDANLALRSLINKAKKQNVPVDIINRAIEKAKSGSGEDYTQNRYEGFGPGGATVIVDCLTDNVNRTVSEVRNCFTKTNNKLGVSGSVSHMYNEWAVVSFTGLTEDETLETLLMADINIEDIEVDGDIITVYGDPKELNTIKTSLEGIDGVKIDVEEIAMIPMNTVTLEGEDLENFQKLLELLNAVDDVDRIYHNVSLPEGADE